MTKLQYKDYNLNDFLLSPPCIGDFVPENYLFCTVNAILDNHHFRSESLAGGRFESIFHRVVKLLQDEGLISLYVQLIDGTKIESVTNKTPLSGKAP